MLSDKITSFFFVKEEKVAFNEKNKKQKKKQMDTLKYLSIFICFIYKKLSIITFKEII